MAQFRQENVYIIALSVDPLDKAQEMAERVKTTFPIGYGLEVPRCREGGRLLGRATKDHSRHQLYHRHGQKGHPGLLCHGPHRPDRRRGRFTFCTGSQEKKGSGKLITRTDNFADNTNGLLAIGPTDVSVGYHANAGSIDGAR